MTSYERSQSSAAHTAVRDYARSLVAAGLVSHLPPRDLVIEAVLAQERGVWFWRRTVYVTLPTIVATGWRLWEIPTAYQQHGDAVQERSLQAVYLSTSGDLLWVGVDTKWDTGARREVNVEIHPATMDDLAQLDMTWDKQPDGTFVMRPVPQCEFWGRAVWGKLDCLCRSAGLQPTPWQGRLGV